MAFGTFFPSNHYTTAIKGKKRRRIERRKNWVLIDLDSAVSKGKYLGVKYYAHHLNHSNRYWWAHLIPFGIWIMNHLSLCVCLCASVFFLLPSIILSIRRKNDLLFVYFVFDISPRLALISLWSSKRREIVFNCSTVCDTIAEIQMRMEEKTKGKQRQEKKTNWQAIE